MIDLAATFSGIAQGISGMFGGPYVAGAVLDPGTPVMSGGSIVTPGGPTERPCIVQVDLATESMRQSEGYAEGDARFLILSATLEGPVSTDARVRVDEGQHVGTWLVSAIERDSMGIYHQGRGRRA
jgi:hypothetical protein